MSEPYFTFEGGEGSIVCDVHGRVDQGPAYLEYNRIDIATMRRLGIQPGWCDILDACGWDMMGRYTTPELSHLLWTLGLCRKPWSAHPRRGVCRLIWEGRMSDVLWVALQKDYPDVCRSAEKLVHQWLLRRLSAVLIQSPSITSIRTCPRKTTPQPRANPSFRHSDGNSRR